MDWLGESQMVIWLPAAPFNSIFSHRNHSYLWTQLVNHGWYSCSVVLSALVYQIQHAVKNIRPESQIMITLCVPSIYQQKPHMLVYFCSQRLQSQGKQNLPDSKILWDLFTWSWKLHVLPNFFPHIAHGDFFNCLWTISTCSERFLLSLLVLPHKSHIHIFAHICTYLLQ